MAQILDIAPLRGLVAVADFGGFQRAATPLHLSQAAVCHHVRRLEAAIGRPLVERHGRGSRFTAGGEPLLDQGRRILALHDQTLRGFGVDTTKTVIIGSTEHAAAQLLPRLSAVLDESLPDHCFRVSIDRGTQLREGLVAGTVDLALLLNAQEHPRGKKVGELVLTWYSSPAWTRPPSSQPIPVVAFDNPCALRARALDTLSHHAIPAVIGAEVTHLAGVQAAVGAGLGVALMATLDQTPEGLVARHDLPAPQPLSLFVCSRASVATEIPQLAVGALRQLLSDQVERLRMPGLEAGLELARGA